MTTRIRAWLWRLRTFGSRVMCSLPIVGPPISRVHDVLFRRRFVTDLQRLNDVLAETELAGRYWVWAGLLLGWARDGAPLAHDRDADFGVFEHDVPLLLEATASLRNAGFLPILRFINNDGQPTEFTYRCHGAKFEFFVFFPEAGGRRYYAYGGPSYRKVQLAAVLPAQELLPFELVNRTWLRPKDFESELTAIYGPWQVPDKNWDYLNDRAVVQREAWRARQTWWGA